MHSSSLARAELGQMLSKWYVSLSDAYVAHNTHFSDVGITRDEANITLHLYSRYLLFSFVSTFL